MLKCQWWAALFAKTEAHFSRSQVYSSSWVHQAAFHLCPLNLMLMNFICYVCTVENNGLNDD